MAMGIDRIIGFLSFILSVGSAFFALWQAHKAKKIKDEIMDEKLKENVRELLTKANIARTDSQRLIPLVSGKQNRGFDPTDSLKNIRSFIEKLNDSEHLFKNNDIEALKKKLKTSFDSYVKETDEAEKRKKGQEIYDYLCDVISKINTYYDEKFYG